MSRQIKLVPTACSNEEIPSSRLADGAGNDAPSIAGLKDSPGNRMPRAH